MVLLNGIGMDNNGRGGGLYFKVFYFIMIRRMYKKLLIQSKLWYFDRNGIFFSISKIQYSINDFYNRSVFDFQ